MDLSVLRNMSYGMYVLGVQNGGKPSGCVVNTAFQITTEPPVVAVSVNHGNYTNELIKNAGSFSVSLLSQQAEMETIAALGFRSGRDADKFESVTYKTTAAGNPILIRGSCGWFDCKVVGMAKQSTHTVFFGEIVEAEKFGENDPMTYAYYHQVKKGVAPKASPIYHEPEREEGKWTCTVCGYVYDGAEGPFEDLPDGWKCPLCGAGKDKFEKR